MSKASNLSGFVPSIGPTNNLSVGVITATTFEGNITGVAATFTGDIEAVAATFTGDVTGVNANFSANVTVGGTLTYEDVTNIDSVGLITARTGINVLAGGIDAVGVVTATSFSGDGSSLTGVANTDFINAEQVNVVGVVTASSFSGDGSNLTGVDSNTINLTASGSIADGDPVIIRTDGKVGIITGSSGSEGKGSFATADTDNSQYIRAIGAGSSEVVMIYKDGGNSNYGTAVVGIVTGTDLTFGTPVAFNSSTSTSHSITYDANADKVVVINRGGTNPYSGEARVGTISGNSISFGTAVNFDSFTGDSAACFDSTNNKIVITYRDGNNGNYGTGIVGTVSGTSISFGSANAFNSVDSEFLDVCFIGDGQVVSVFHHNSDSGKGHAVVGTVSGTTISFGSTVKFTDDQDIRNISCVYDDANDKVVIIWAAGTSGDRKAVVATPSGTGGTATLTFGDTTTFGTTSSNQTTPHMFSVFNTYIDKVVVAYRDGDNSDKGTVALGTVSGTSISFGTGFVYENDGYTDFNWPALISGGNQNVFIGYRDYSDSSHARGVIYSAPYSDTNVTAANFLGFSDGAYTDGQTAKIRFAGVDDAQVGLTTGSFYYVQGSGDLGTTAGNPSVEAGVAISATQILMKKNQ